MLRRIGTGRCSHFFESQCTVTKTSKWLTNICLGTLLSLKWLFISEEIWPIMPCIITSIISGMNWHTWVMEQHAMAQWVWPLQHPCPLNLLLLWKKQKRKSAPQRESNARDLEPVMGKSQIQTTILRMERRAVKDTVPNLLLEIHMNSTGGQGANNLCHYPPCASKVFLHHQTMLRLACFLFRLPYCCVCWSAFLPTEIELLINFWSKLEFQNSKSHFLTRS